MTRRQRALAVACAVLCTHAAEADEILSYLNLSSQDKLHSQVGLFLGHEGLSVKADVTLEGQDGTTRVLPRVTSTFSSIDWLHVKTVFEYGDWNAGGTSEPAVDTRVSVRSAVPFVEHIEGRVHQTAAEVSQSLRFGFADVGVRALGGGTVNVKTDLTLQSAPSGPHSKLTSSFAFGEALDLRTVLGLDAASYDTKLVYRSSMPLIAQLEGGLQRSMEGDVYQSLGVRFPEISRGDGILTPFTVRSGAILEETIEPTGADSTRMGFETELAGFRSALLGGRSKLSLRVERRLDEEHENRTSLAYDHAWAPRDETSIALNLKMLREQGEVAPTVGISWQSRF
ncbi:MAG TPA: hypothetical protein VIN61_05305 [Gammaproteobacteria bacterium]